MKQTFIKTRLNKLVMKRLLTIFLVNIAFCFSLFAQERVVSGVVTDATGASLPGVNVTVKGTTIGVISDVDGKFSIKVPGSTSVLLVTYIGYKDQEMPVGEVTSFKITLEEDVLQVDEVVVVGYGVQKKKLVTGATVQVKNDDLVKNRVTRVESALQGLTPGMMVVKQSGQPGADYNITIRGMSSINGNSPLVLVDGVPGSLSSLNPEDIETVDVLKDAASAAIYGSRAANGVILVTTKKGKAGEMQISYDAYYGVSNPTKTVDVLGAKEYAMAMNEARKNSSPTKPAYFTPAYIDSLGTGTDWQKEAIQDDVVSVSHYLGITGGSEKSNYSISLSYKREEGVFNYEDKSNYERMGFRVNSEHKVKSFLKIGENLTYAHRATRALGNGDQYNNFYHDLLMASPIIPAYDNKSYDGFGRSKFQDQQGNPIATMHYYNNEKKYYDDIIGDIYAEIELFKGLKFRTDFGGTLGYNYNTNSQDTFSITIYTPDIPPITTQSMYRDFSYNFDNVLTYEKSLGEHSFALTLGSNATDSWFYNQKTEVWGYLTNPAPVISNVAMIDTAFISGNFGKGDSRYSYFGRISYNYKEKYMTTLSLRRDASSRFGPKNKIGYFPSASAGWVISKESFMENISAIDFFKLRASWGQNGKEPYSQYRYLATVGSENRYYTIGGEKQLGISPNIFANPTLKWESSEQINIGFDSRFLKSLSFSFDYYKKSSKDWIMQKTVAGYSGIAGISTENPYINGGNVTNSGVEFDLGYNKKFGDLFFEARANFSYNTNEVTEVPDSIIHGSASTLYNGSEEFYRVQEGYPIGYFWGYKTDGIYQDTAEINLSPIAKKKKAMPGDVKFVDSNNDGVLNDKDKTMIGNPNPKYIFGFNLSLSYKGLDFTANLQGQGGNQVVKSYRSQERFFFNYTKDEYDNRWTGAGTSNRLPRITLSDEGNRNWRNFSDLYIYDADFLRLKSASIGYDFKQAFKKLPFQQLRLYFTATNLFTLTGYNGIDPEIGYGSFYDSSGALKDGYASGIDLGNYPPSRTYMVGVNVKF